VKGKAGEDLVEKQNAEMGLMPVVAAEAATYGYEAETGISFRAFLNDEKPMLTFDDGVDVMRILMTAYMSALADGLWNFLRAGSIRLCPTSPREMEAVTLRARQGIQASRESLKVLRSVAIPWP
jgi:hypothetical protein